MEKKWYILNIMSGQEVNVAEDIRQNSMIDEVIVPMKSEMRVKRGKKVRHDIKLFPGYIFIKAVLNSDLKKFIRSIPRPVSFLGGMNSPKEVSKAEIIKIKQKVDEGERDKNDKVLVFEIGEVVKVTDGPFESFQGTVESFNAEKQRIRISISIFGRPTSVELEASSQVEKI